MNFNGRNFVIQYGLGKLRAHAATAPVPSSSAEHQGMGLADNSNHNSITFQFTGMTLRDMVSPSDKTNLFRDYVGSRTHLWGSKINIPNVRDGQGRLIRPNEYIDALPHLTPVTVDVNLKLQVVSLICLSNFITWSFQLGHRTKSDEKRRHPVLSACASQNAIASCSASII